MRTCPLALLLLIIAYLTGCGFKGPLFIPVAKPAAQKPGTAAKPEAPPERPVPADAVPPPK